MSVTNKNKKKILKLLQEFIRMKTKIMPKETEVKFTNYIIEGYGANAKQVFLS